MIWFKRIDLLGQLVLLVLGAVMIIRELSAFDTWCLLLGSWQLLSLLIHHLLRSHFIPGMLRSTYWKLLVGTIIAMAIALPLIWIGAFVLLLGMAPVLALLYMEACRHELIMIRHRDFIHFKN